MEIIGVIAQIFFWGLYLFAIIWGISRWGAKGLAERIVRVEFFMARRIFYGPLEPKPVAQPKSIVDKSAEVATLELWHELFPQFLEAMQTDRITPERFEGFMKFGDAAARRK